MPAVTVVSQRTNVNGSYREKYFKVNIANTGDTLATGFKQVNSVGSNNPAAVTLITPTLGSLAFTTTGAVNGLLVRVTGI